MSSGEASGVRRRLEEAEKSRLAPWALRSALSARAHALEGEGRAFDYRPAFQRDRDRVLYSRAFRRLHGKTQLYLAEAEEQHRNRLTHTLEVAQLARTLARALRLNEDLVEAVALAHDLGRGPFGRSGEAALGAILEGGGTFRPNLQALRVVDLLEARYETHPGLNLTGATREGILKLLPGHEIDADPDLDLTSLRPADPPHLEAQAVSLADRVVTPIHDVDDALEAGDLPLAAVERSGAGQAVIRRLGPRYREARGAFGRRNLLHRALLHLLATDAVVTSSEGIEAWAAEAGQADPVSAEDARENFPADGVSLSARAAAFLDELRELVRSRVVGTRRVIRSDDRAARAVRRLIGAYRDDPRLLPDHVLLRYKSAAGLRFLRDVPAAELAAEVEGRYHGRPEFLRAVVDHLAAMTDRFALAELARLGGPPDGAAS